MLMANVPLALRQNLWFRHDSTLAHFVEETRDHLTATFGERWIGRGGPIAWPLRSPELTHCDFFMWDAIKEMIYETSIEDVHVLP